MTVFDEATLGALREQMRERLSPARYAHTLGTEECVARMARALAPEQEPMLRAAALLHDCTKEYSEAQTMALLAREGITLRPDEAAAPATWHAITAPLVIERDFPRLATPALLSAVRWHTTGRADMTLCEAMLYLADVIEPGRTYPACVALRARYFAAEAEEMTTLARVRHLADVVLASLEGVRDSLLASGRSVCEDTLAAIASLTKKKTF